MNILYVEIGLKSSITRHAPEAACWGAGATTLRIATLALVHSATEHYVPVWCRSTHTCLIDPTVNDALRIVTGCLGPTSADNLPILAGIQPTELCRNGATLSLACHAMQLEHLSIECRRMAPQIETTICTCRTTSYQFN